MSHESQQSSLESNSVSSNDPILRRSIACSRCRYNLEGLRANGRCPECGASILETLASSIDLATDRLAPLENGSRFGGMLLLAAICTLAAASATVGPVAYFVAELMTTISPTGSSSALSASLSLISTALLTVGRMGACLGVLVTGPWLWQSTSFDRMRFRKPSRSDLLMSGGFLLWLLALSPSVAQLSLPLATYGAIPAIMVLVGLRPLVAQAGARSKVYRASVARQPVQLLVLACAFAGGASLTKLFLQVGFPETEEWQHLLGIVALASFALLEIGLLYLVLNCWWIWRALASPPPQLDSLLGTPRE